VIKLIRASKDANEAREKLMEREWPANTAAELIALIDDPRHRMSSSGTAKLTAEQTKAILDLRLQRLTALGRDEIKAELDKLAAEIADYLDILRSRVRIQAIIKDELAAIKKEFATPRRTVIIDQEGEMEDEDLIQREDMVVTVSHAGYVKRVPLSTYRAQKRGGKGRAGMQTREEDFVTRLFVASTHTPVLFFSSRGQVYKEKVWRLPLAAPQARGKALINILPLEQGENITTIMPLPEDEKTWGQRDVMFATTRGTVRRNKLSDFADVRRSGIIAMKLDDGDAIVDVQGWYGPSAPITRDGLYNGVAPARLLDTRFGTGTGTHVGPLGQGQTIRVQATGRGNVPGSGVSAVVLNVTATEPTSNSYLTVFPTGSAVPNASNLNFVAGATIPNRVIVPVGSGGGVSILNGWGQVHVVVDIGGWFSNATNTVGGSRFVALEPQRILRLQKMHILVGQDTDSESTPYGAAMPWIVKLDKEQDWIGKWALEHYSHEAPAAHLVGFTLPDRQVPTEGSVVVDETNTPAGQVTSARYSPVLGCVIGMAWVPSALARDGAKITISDAGRTMRADIQTKPFFDPQGEVLRS